MTWSQVHIRWSPSLSPKSFLWYKQRLCNQQRQQRDLLSLLMSSSEYLMNTHSILQMKQRQRLVGIELTLWVMHRKDYNRIFWMHLYQLFESSKYFLHNSRSTKHMDISFKLELHFLSNPIRIKCILQNNHYLKCIKLKIAQIDLYHLIIFPFEVSRTP